MGDPQVPSIGRLTSCEDGQWLLFALDMADPRGSVGLRQVQTPSTLPPPPGRASLTNLSCHVPQASPGKMSLAGLAARSQESTGKCQSGREVGPLLISRKELSSQAPQRVPTPLTGEEGRTSLTLIWVK